MAFVDETTESFFLQGALIKDRKLFPLSKGDLMKDGSMDINCTILDSAI